MVEGDGINKAITKEIKVKVEAETGVKKSIIEIKSLYFFFRYKNTIIEIN